MLACRKHLQAESPRLKDDNGLKVKSRLQLARTSQVYSDCMPVDWLTNTDDLGKTIAALHASMCSYTTPTSLQDQLLSK